MSNKIELVRAVIADHGSEVVFSAGVNVYTYTMNRMSAEIVRDMAKRRPGKAMNLAKQVADSVTKN